MDYILAKSEQLHGDTEGLGGDLGGLAGADAYCTEAAELAYESGAITTYNPALTWRAFLSTRAEDAIDRIGTGPWYNAKGLLMSDDIAGLLQLRPAGSTEIVWNDGRQDWPFNQCLTDEYGMCVHSDRNGDSIDSHDTLTGSNAEGRLLSNADDKYNCWGWTSLEECEECPVIGHSWPRQLNSEDQNDAHWIYTHNLFPININGCNRNINVTDTMESGVGGEGGYGAWYCFAVTDGRLP